MGGIKWDVVGGKRLSTSAEIGTRQTLRTPSPSSLSLCLDLSIGPSAIEPSLMAFF